MTTYRIISGDSHFVEPPDMWAERVDKKFHDRAPHTVKGYEGREGEFFVCENIVPVAVAGFFGSGKSAEELPEHSKRGFEAAPKSVWDPAERLKEQDRDGVSAEVLYTSMGMLLYGMDDAELRAACFRAFNDYAAEYCKYDPKRMVGLGSVTLEDVPGAIRELKRCATKGLHGVMIVCSPPDDRPFSHRDYDQFWGVAQDLNMPVSLHILTGRKGHGIDFSRILTSYMRFPSEIQGTLATMVFGGVFERFPRLKVVSAECDVSWMPHFMYRLDHAYERLRHFEGVSLKMMPSEYVKRQIYATFQFETMRKDLVEVYGADKMLWSSDYPHTDSPWPHSREYVEGPAFERLTPQETQMIVADNAARLYNFN
jgi:predicted TIM-barrel fold metal-dependent hydrolase